MRGIHPLLLREEVVHRWNEGAQAAGLRQEGRHLLCAGILHTAANDAQLLLRTGHRLDALDVLVGGGHALAHHHLELLRRHRRVAVGLGIAAQHPLQTRHRRAQTHIELAHICRLQQQLFAHPCRAVGRSLRTAGGFLEFRLSTLRHLGDAFDGGSEGFEGGVFDYGDNVEGGICHGVRILGGEH